MKRPGLYLAHWPPPRLALQLHDARSRAPAAVKSAPQDRGARPLTRVLNSGPIIPTRGPAWEAIGRIVKRGSLRRTYLDPSSPR